jgi:uncharacterized RDD family membrane protein YckC
MAEWWRRALAFGLDALVLAVPWSIILSVTLDNTSTLDSNNIPRSAWVGFGIGFIVVLGYFSFLDGSARGQTVGKMALGIAVRDIGTASQIGAGRALGRRLIFFATYFGFVVLFVFNALSPLWDSRRQAWHDKAVGSCVVRSR